MKVSQKISHNHNPLVLVMSMVAGLGVILIMTALAVGVIQGSAADSTAIGLLFVGGLALFLVGAAFWYGLTQPQRHFDDISVPLDDGHHGHSEPHDEQAIVPAGESKPVAHH